ncbi:hypothetical protein BS78_02G247600 [Paspalum vaginatum]|nr:hypothetical protein BS78_02G247600 [Paspalum vaginatum]
MGSCASSTACIHAVTAHLAPCQSQVQANLSSTLLVDGSSPSHAFTNPNSPKQAYDLVQVMMISVWFKQAKHTRLFARCELTGDEETINFPYGVIKATVQQAPMNKLPSLQPACMTAPFCLWHLQKVHTTGL